MIDRNGVNAYKGGRGGLRTLASGRDRRECDGGFWGALVVVGVWEGVSAWREEERGWVWMLGCCLAVLLP